MIRFLEVTQQHYLEPELISLTNVIGVRKNEYNETILDLADGSCKSIRMDYESLKVYLGGMILGA